MCSRVTNIFTVFNKKKWKRNTWLEWHYWTRKRDRSNTKSEKRICNQMMQWCRQCIKQFQVSPSNHTGLIPLFTCRIQSSYEHWNKNKRSEFLSINKSMAWHHSAHASLTYRIIYTGNLVVFFFFFLLSFSILLICWPSNNHYYPIGWCSLRTMRGLKLQAGRELSQVEGAIQRHWGQGSRVIGIGTNWNFLLIIMG